jgi:hypothetical protein
MADRPQKITLGEMRDMGVRGVLIYCADYRRSHSIALRANQWPRLSDIERRFICQVCGKRGADICMAFGRRGADSRPAPKVVTITFPSLPSPTDGDHMAEGISGATSCKEYHQDVKIIHWAAPRRGRGTSIPSAM